MPFADTDCIWCDMSVTFKSGLFYHEPDDDDTIYFVCKECTSDQGFKDFMNQVGLPRINK